MKGSAMAGFNKDTVREVNDFYPTPSSTTRAILDLVNLKGSIYEPACGNGAISKVLEEYYPNGKIYSSDLFDRGYGKVGYDFIKHDYEFEKFDNIITNPPFKLAKEFIQKALLLANDKVIMFAKIQLLEGVKRQKFLKESPLKYVYVFSKRQSLYANGIKGNKGSSTMCFAWYVWEQGYIGEPIIRWI
jgi:hypothetical protein